MDDRKSRVEAFLRELDELCVKHGVVLDGTEDDGVLIVSRRGDDVEECVEGEGCEGVLGFFNQDDLDPTSFHLAARNEWGSIVPGPERYMVSQKKEQKHG